LRAAWRRDNEHYTMAGQVLVRGLTHAWQNAHEPLGLA